LQPAAILRVLVDADTGGASANLKRFDRQVRNTGESSKRASANIDRMHPALLRMGNSASRASRSLGRLGPQLEFTTRIPVAKIAAIGEAIAAAVAPTVALTSALAPLTGLLGALPGLATAAAQGIGTIALGMAGVGTALKDAFALQKTAAKDATTSLQAHRAAAEAVRSAIQNVGDAERGLAAAQLDAKRAQQDLSQARRDATRQLVDMRLAAQGAVLSEKEARLELTKAIEEQVAVMDDASSSAADIREADLNVQRARLGLKESTVESKRAQEDYTSAQKKGVRGSDQVVSAQDSLHSAQLKVADSQRALVDATRQVRLAQLDQAESVGQAAGGVQKLQQSMAGLPPAARNFVRFVVGLKPKLDSLRQTAAAGIFPGLTRGIRSAMQNFGVVRKVIASTASALGNLAEQAGKRIGGREWGRDLQVQGERNVVTISRLGRAALDLGDGFRHIMLAAGPLVGFLTSSAARFAEIFASWAKGARESGQLDAFFQRTIKTTKITVKAFWDFGRALINVGRIASRVWGNDLLAGIGNVAKRFRDWTESVRGQRSIESYFVRWRKRWEAIGQAVADVIGQYNRLRREGKSAATAFTTVFADSLAKLIPIVANNLGSHMPEIVGGFVRGFLNADAWGRLLVGGWLIAKFGGLKAFVAVGRLIGGGVGAGVAEGTATALTGAAAGQAAVGQIMGKRVGEAAAGGVAGSMLGKLGSKILPFAKKAGGLGIGLVLADGVLSEISRRTSQSADPFAELKRKAGVFANPNPINKLSRVFGVGGDIGAQKLSEDLKKVAEASRGISPERARQLKDQISGLKGVSKEARAGLLGIVDAAADRGNKIAKIGDEFARMKSGAILNLKDLRKETGANFRAIADSMGTNSARGQRYVEKNFKLAVGDIVDFKRRGIINASQAGQTIAALLKNNTGRGKDALEKNMLAAERAIARTMSRSGKITQQGTDLIRALMVNAMKNMGLSPDTIRMSLNKRESAKKGPVTPGQTGMVVTGGKPHGDSVHALLERGEVVINRKAVQKMGGPDAVNQINRNVPRFQKGGIAGMVGAANKLDQAHFPYLWGGGHQGSPAPFGPMDCSGAVSYVLQHGGVQIPTMVSGALAGAGKPGPGKVTVFANPTHTFMRIGNRYFGTSGANPGGGAGWFPDPGAGYRSRFAERHFAATGDIAERVPRLTVNAPDSGIKTIVQGALDATRRGANRKLRGVASTALGGGDIGDPGPFGGGGGAGANRKLGARMAKSLYGWGGGQFRALNKLWTGESGWVTTADNPNSDAYGIPQALPGSKMASAGRDWATNPATQIKWGLGYIRDRYGNPSNAYNEWLARSPHWYQKGGVVGGKDAHWGALGALGSQRQVDSFLGRHRPKALAGPLGKVLNKTLSALRHTKNAKKRGTRMRQLEKRFRKDLGLPAKLQDQMKFVSGAAELFGQRADNAASLNVENDDGTTTLGVLQGKDQGGWLNEQLGALLGWRNMILDATAIIEKRRKQAMELLKKARKRLVQVKATIKSVTKVQDKRRDQLRELRKKPKVNKNKIADLRKVIMRTEGWLGGRQREETGLETIVPTLKARIGTLTGDNGLGGLSSNLVDLQGIGGPMNKIKGVPPLGTIPGGSIFDVQLSLRDLATKATATASDSPVTDDTNIELLKQLLREANLRTAVSERQFDIFKNFDATSGAGPFMGAFARGGVALVGERGPELAHLPSGTRVHSAADTAALVSPNWQIIVNGDIVNVPRGKQPIETRQLHARDIRASNRSPLPGRGGGR
jgi:hypothetical protein